MALLLFIALVNEHSGGVLWGIRIVLHTLFGRGLSFFIPSAMIVLASVWATRPHAHSIVPALASSSFGALLLVCAYRQAGWVGHSLYSLGNALFTGAFDVVLGVVALALAVVHLWPYGSDLGKLCKKAWSIRVPGIPRPEILRVRRTSSAKTTSPNVTPGVPPSPAESIFAKSEYAKPSPASVRRDAETIRRTCAEFKVELTPRACDGGLFLSRYDFTLAKGVKLAKLTGLHDEIAMALAAPNVTITALNGLARVEVANSSPSILRLRDMLRVKPSKDGVSVPIGFDSDGSPIVDDLLNTNHIMVAGATGGGKSCFLNSLICGLTSWYTKAHLQLLLIDVKRVEFIGYSKLPHLVMPVVTEREKALDALHGLTCEMERRYELIASAGCKKLSEYNRGRTTNKLPYIVCVIDEAGDLVGSDDKLESTAKRLGSLARAAGIFMVMATQRPDVNIISGAIKTNFATKVAFRTSSDIDSRVIGVDGAERLDGKGRMIYHVAGVERVLQGAKVENEEVDAWVTHLASTTKTTSTNEPVSEDVSPSQSSPTVDVIPRVVLSREEEDVVKVCKAFDSGKPRSVNSIKKILGVGEPKANAFMKMLQKRGIIGNPPGLGGKSWEYHGYSELGVTPEREEAYA
jgi:S-DNA-T family DNA segregation ATPase FtsK/SpoIIIE